MRTLVVPVVLIAFSCKGGDPAPATPAKMAAPGSTDVVVIKDQKPDPALEQEREEYVADVMAFTSTTREQVRARMQRGSVPLKEEWEAWEKDGPMTEDRMKAFYKQTTNYIYELGEWHLWTADKRASDVALVENIKKLGIKNVLDFGGGVGLNALMLARAGIDVTLADLDSKSLEFAQFRAARHDIELKVWKTDVEPMPPDAKYDVILALDVLEHLPADILEDSVNKLVKLKHLHTRIMMSAPFGRTSVHPMHLDASDHTKRQVNRLRTELPKD